MSRSTQRTAGSGASRPLSGEARLKDPRFHLREVDPRFSAIIDSGPPPALGRDFHSAFEPLVKSIVYQQLSGQAAGTIYGRLVTRFGDATRVVAEKVVAADPEGLREVGLSRQKALYIRGLAEAAMAGEIPVRVQLETMDDEAVIDALVRFKGIGRWTVEMLLMFWMGRRDVLPVDDLGIRKGLRVIDGLSELPAPREVAQRGELWRPYRSTASWYLWRAAE